jgi:hypothetical protein
MRNIILTEKQIKKLKNLLVEENSIVFNNLLNEQGYQINQQGKTVTLTQDFVVPQQSLDLRGFTIKQGAVFKLTEKGNLYSNVNTILSDKNIEEKNKSIKLNCQTNSIQFGEKVYAAEQVKKTISELCKNVKDNLSKLSKVYGVSGGVGYTQNFDQVIKSDNGKSLTIPKGTGYVKSSNGLGLTFTVGNNSGWFDCKYQSFTISDNKDVKYKNEYLSKFLSDSLCKTTKTPTGSKIGGGNTGGGNTGGVSVPKDIDLYI